jgi:hypothetical protein
MDELTKSVLVKAERAVETVLNNMLPMPRCTREKGRCRELREKVKSELAYKLGAVGPQQIKSTEHY